VTGVWIAVVVVALGTAAMKLVPAIIVGGRPMPERLFGVLALLAPTVLAALVVTQGLATGERLVLDARAVGLIAAGAAIALRMPVVVVAVVAAAAAALVRAVT